MKQLDNGKAAIRCVPCMRAGRDTPLDLTDERRDAIFKGQAQACAVCVEALLLELRAQRKLASARGHNIWGDE